MISRELSKFRKTLTPSVSVITTLKDSEIYSDSKQEDLTMTKRTKVYLGDVLDHVSVIVENIHSLEDESKSLIDLVCPHVYQISHTHCQIFNTISHSTNETMRGIAVLSLLFLPTTFLAGVYGMNFTYFPELQFELGFIYFWLLFLAAVITTITISIKVLHSSHAFAHRFQFKWIRFS